MRLIESSSCCLLLALLAIAFAARFFKPLCSHCRYVIQRDKCRHMTSSSCSSIISNTVANDAMAELRRLHEILNGPDPRKLQGFSVLLSPARQRQSELDSTQTTRRRSTDYRPPVQQASLKPLMDVSVVNTNRSQASIATTAKTRSSKASSAPQRISTTTSRPSLTEADRLRNKINQTLRSSREMHLLLTRQHNLLEEASHQLAALSRKEARTFH